MVISFKVVAVVSSIFLTLITITMQMKIEASQWKEIPPNLMAEIQRLFKEFEQKDANMKKLAEHSDVKEPTGVLFAEVEAYPGGPLYNFVTIKFDTIKKVSTTKKVPTIGSKEKDMKFVIALVLGRIDNTKLNLDFYYLITGGNMIEYNDDESSFRNAQEKASESAISALDTLGFKLETVAWHDNVWQDMETEMTGVGNEIVQKIKTRLRLEPISISVEKMNITYEAYASILLEGRKLSTLRLAVCQLTENSGSPTTDITNNAKSLSSTKQLFFCVVLDKQSESTNVLYTNKPTISKLEAFVEGETFVIKNVIWDTDNTGKAGFEKLKEYKKNLPDLVTKAILRKLILETQLANHMTNEDVLFPEKLNHYVNLILSMDKDKIEKALSANDIPIDPPTLKPNDIPNDLALAILNQANSETPKLAETLRLEYLKVNNLSTTSLITETLYWFEVHHSNKILQCVARSKTNAKTTDQLNLEITDMFEDKEHFSVQNRKSMLEYGIFTTHLIPLYWHSSAVTTIRPTRSKNVASLFKSGVEPYMPAIQATVNKAIRKGNLPDKSYDFSDVKVALRINPSYKDIFRTGIYFTAKFADDPICYIFFDVWVDGGSMEFTLAEGSTLYNTEKAVIDAMETMMIPAVFGK